MTTKIDDALVERMVALVRTMAEDQARWAYSNENYKAAADIADQLPPPPDPDLIEARAMAKAEGFDDNNDYAVKVILAGIKRGRELAAQ